MKVLYFLLGVLSVSYSCSEMEDLPDNLSLLSGTTTRTAGDGVYDVLGYGYDITDEYMGENSTKLRVVDVATFIRENPNRFDNPFLGVIDQRVYAGEDAQSFINQIITDTNFSGSIASLPGKKTEGGFFQLR